MGELRRRVLEVHHVKVGPHPTSSPLTHTHVHLSPWLMYLDKDWSNTGDGEKRERREKGRGEEKREKAKRKEVGKRREEEKWRGGEGKGEEGGEMRKRERIENTCGSFTCCIRSENYDGLTILYWSQQLPLNSVRG